MALLHIFKLRSYLPCNHIVSRGKLCGHVTIHLGSERCLANLLRGVAFVRKYALLLLSCKVRTITLSILHALILTYNAYALILPVKRRNYAVFA